jgi:hypothetical protein
VLKKLINSVKYVKLNLYTYRSLLHDETCSMLVVLVGLKQGELGCLSAISLFNNSNMLDRIHRKVMEYTQKLILHVQHIILLHTNKLNNFSILLMCVTSMISVAPDLRFLTAAPRSLGFLFGPSLCLFMVWPLVWHMKQCTLFLFGQSYPNHTYHFRNPSPYRSSGYGIASSYISPS